MSRTDETLLHDIHAFLPCATPGDWFENALNNIDNLLIDHANCEKKAASTALNLIYRYVDNFTLLHKMSRLAREELRHFEQVIAIMETRGIQYRPLSASRYAGGLREQVRTHEPGRLIDTLIVGAFIEARSCERFAAVAPLLDEELKTFYLSLLKSEARHYKDYLHLARAVAEEAGCSHEIDVRIREIAGKEKELIQTPDLEFRFHSGPLAA